MTPEEELQVIGNLVRCLGEPFWHGLDLGLRYNLTVYGVLGLGLMTSAGPLEALKRGAAYWGATPALIRSRLVLAQPGPAIHLDYSHLPDGAREFLLGRNLGSIYAMHQDLLPGQCLGINGVWLTLPPCKGMERLEDLYAAPFIPTNRMPI